MPTCTLTLDVIDSYALRFSGMSIDIRKSGTHWPKPWRLKRYVSKASCRNFACTLYFDSLGELVTYIINTDAETD